MPDCRTRYPIMLIHGLNRRDDCGPSYWGRVPDILRAQGARVYLSGQDAVGSIDDNALALRRRAREILTAEDCEKLNLIAHSKGGLEARFLISSLNMAPCIASLTTICTPHHGSQAAAVWLRRKVLCKLAGRALETGWKLAGDQSPDFERALAALTPDAMERFNRENPDSPLVYYQSWGARLDQAGWDLMDRAQLWLTKADGPTDGLVTPESAVWGRYRGTLVGISHQDSVDSRRRRLAAFSAEVFYTALVHELAELGF